MDRPRTFTALLGLLVRVGLSGLAWVPAPTWGGPPFRTDDPVPVEPQHWEVYAFSTGTYTAGETSAILPGIDANYGAAPNVQLHATLPVAFDQRSSVARFGYGDSELGIKYRFLEEDPAGLRPQAAIYPALDFPTGNASRNLGAGHTHAFLPLWVQKSLGEWTTFAGVGYSRNPGAGNRNFWYFGWAVQRQVTADLAVGGEVYHQTAETAGGNDQTGFNLGVLYDLTDHYHLLFSAGRGLQNPATTNQLSYYAAIQFTF